jgi:hypothetical protein
MSTPGKDKKGNAGADPQVVLNIPGIDAGQQAILDNVNAMRTEMGSFATKSDLHNELVSAGGAQAYKAEVTGAFDTFDAEGTSEAQSKDIAGFMTELGIADRRVHRFGMNPVAAIEDWALNGRGVFRGILKTLDFGLVRAGAGRGIWDIGASVLNIFRG